MDIRLTIRFISSRRYICSFSSLKRRKFIFTPKLKNVSISPRQSDRSVQPKAVIASKIESTTFTPKPVKEHTCSRKRFFFPEGELELCSLYHEQGCFVNNTVCSKTIRKLGFLSWAKLGHPMSLGDWYRTQWFVKYRYPSSEDKVYSPVHLKEFDKDLFLRTPFDHLVDYMDQEELEKFYAHLEESESAEEQAKQRVLDENPNFGTAHLIEFEASRRIDFMMQDMYRRAIYVLEFTGLSPDLGVLGCSDPQFWEVMSKRMAEKVAHMASIQPKTENMRRLYSPGRPMSYFVGMSKVMDRTVQCAFLFVSRGVRGKTGCLMEPVYPSLE